MKRIGPCDRIEGRMLKWERSSRSPQLRRLVRGLLGLSLCIPMLSQEAQTPPTFRVSTRLVVQTVSVTDKEGKPVEGLTVNDFVLTEDNLPQTISVFEFHKLDDSAPPRFPSTAAGGPVQPSTEVRNSPVPPGYSRYQDRRLLALY